MEVTGPEALRILVDSDHGMYRRCLAPLAERFAIDIALGAGERPAVLLGQHPRLFLERDDRHHTSPVCEPFFLGTNAQGVLFTAVGVLCSPFSPCAVPPCRREN